jgi:hypothetical protein
VPPVAVDTQTDTRRCPSDTNQIQIKGFIHRKAPRFTAHVIDGQLPALTPGHSDIGSVSGNGRKRGNRDTDVVPSC